MWVGGLQCQYMYVCTGQMLLFHANQATLPLYVTKNNDRLEVIKCLGSHMGVVGVAIICKIFRSDLSFGCIKLGMPIGLLSYMHSLWFAFIYLCHGEYLEDEGPCCCTSFTKEAKINISGVVWNANYATFICTKYCNQFHNP